MVHPTLPESKNLHQVQVHGPSSVVKYIVGAIPKVNSYFGTLTRIFVACNVTTPDVIYCLKDSWRSVIHPSEMEFYTKIDNKTENVVHYYDGGDVPGQSTTIDQHYRIVIDLCRPLSEFKNGKLLITGIIGGMKGKWPLNSKLVFLFAC
jgi:hypothetical protein